MPLATIDTLNSERVCEHMNIDHPACVYGMVTEMYGVNDRISNSVVMIRFAMDRCDFTFCMNGKELHAFRKFEPPLTSIKEARPRMAQIYHKAMTPKLGWIYMDPVALPLVMLNLFLTYLTLVLGVNGMVNVINHSPGMYSMVQAHVGSAESFARMITVFGYVTMGAHALEALFVGLHAKKTFSLSRAAVIEWVIFTQLAGLPILNRFLRFLEVHGNPKVQKKEE
mmetsp:Transcript_21231/g.35130  ORF Transcript_21231/g.35130 Transcript_21231/m.35130 type:complete len:225 (-) Transcript_21231:692-1366(-)|eukprot:CAMPEP_0119010752 /NCGR_PEP_ID=MMETSP1176-20130426/5223_1 /TAXON_ID=265551 /ORGANISM="Synedropsis recta cf, Strain CCMP1620" /LENGTH=224 /DNA_ID=CAMNT_0006963475 /DNA_START=101 /DNA_END=775 /DNA_ORIENTATION=+